MYHVLASRYGIYRCKTAYVLKVEEIWEWQWMVNVEENRRMPYSPIYWHPFERRQQAFQAERSRVPPEHGRTGYQELDLLRTWRLSSLLRSQIPVWVSTAWVNARSSEMHSQASSWGKSVIFTDANNATHSHNQSKSGVLIWSGPHARSWIQGDNFQYRDTPHKI
jgi:hypothetical protein